MTINVSHTVASIENLGSGVTYCVTSLSAAQASQGLRTAVYSVGSDRSGSITAFEDRRYPNDFEAVPVFRRLGASRAMRRALNANKPDIVHAHGLWMLPNTYRAKGAALVISPHGMLTPVALSFSPRKKALFRLLFQNRALASAALFSATAESEYDDIRSFGLSQPVAVIPNGIDLPDLPIDRTCVDGRSVLSLGRIHPKKGLDKLVRAWAAVERPFPDWELRIVGPDELGHAAELKELVRSLDLKNVSIEGAVFGQAKTELMAGVNLFVLPSRSENFAMTVAESLALGVPVISTKGAPWAGLETHGCGWWVDHGAEPLAAALRSAMSQPLEGLRSMGHKGRAWMAQDYSWERVANMTLDTYLWALEGGEPPDFVRAD
ncbi:glycosyltransferase (plasmid) [Sulfitobacter sp. W027]|uniref:glycosyltransferase n=1 Tax=Sulfitobacter sp. W027 TaxID=2867025 RepID=UPI0021A93D1A|nr:glycosyltransferase [Sulfitobacter sp. W027]UWR35730.1 glycosyltransferase [Sulfitobacter sp. W027]